MSQEEFDFNMEFKTPVQCVICGKVAESARLMHNLGPGGMTKDMLPRIYTKYLGQCACGAPDDCWTKTLKPIEENKK